MVFDPERLNRPGGSIEVATNPDDAVAIVYTSGTTGLPKGACYTNRALDAVREIEHAVDPVDHPKTLGGTPMAHMGFMTKIGAHIVHAPQQDGFAPGYYSVLFEDPDGTRLEINHVPGKGLLAADGAQIGGGYADGTQNG